MKASSALIRYLFSVCAAIFMAAGCGQSQNQSNGLVPQGPKAASPAVGRLGSSTTWMASDAKARDLLYVANVKEKSVYVYAYPGGEPKGQLRGADASGLCSDKIGDVYVLEGERILKYAHAGTHPIALLSDALGEAQFCTVDPSSGDLAVTGGARPGVAIYANARARTKIYSGDLAHYWSAAYDDAGNLFVEGTREGGRVALLELRKGDQHFQTVTLNGARLGGVGALQWDGEHLAVEAPGRGSSSATLLRYAMREGRAILVGRSLLDGVDAPPGFWIHSGKIAVPKAAGISLYVYPAGGNSTNDIKDVRKPRAVTISPASQPAVAVTTYHYDTMRTGWNSEESALTYGSIESGSFGLLDSISLDDQVDAQPLLVPDETTTTGVDPGQHSVVYVETENDTVYAIDAISGTILFTQSLGSPVPAPLGCNNNGPEVGINGTPVIDLNANVMYVIAYTLASSDTPTYTIHELNLSNLTDAVTPVVVSASHTLTDGTTYAFDATYQRQRAALLEANGNVYAGFGSFCDFGAAHSRGWLLGWQAGTLTPLAANRLNDALAPSPSDEFFLSSIWMSGDGPAVDSSGNIYFATGNSHANTYNGVTNVQESVVKVSSDLTQLVDIFTPQNEESLDKHDRDFGSGGVMLLPTTASGQSYATAAGKYGTMYLLNQNNLGGYHRHRDHVLATQVIGDCWCGESYFDAATDSARRIVASGGNDLTVWKLANGSKPKLMPGGSVQGLPGAQDPGFFTSVSSNGNNPDAIIWAVTRPQQVPGPISLYAFSSQPPKGSSTLETLFEGTAGYWNTPNGNADLVPVVANGRVYVASYEQLNIFGLGSSEAKPAPPRGLTYRASPGAPHVVTGTLVSVRGSLILLRTRTGQIVRVDAAEAQRHERSADLVAGEAFNVGGTYDAAGVLHAKLIIRAKPSPSSWLPDR